MKKPTSSQQAAIRNGRGLVSASEWRNCMEYLHRLFHEEDPPESVEWKDMLRKVQIAASWLLEQSLIHRGRSAHRCLELSLHSSLSDELIHEQESLPCIFTGRRKPLLYRTAQDREARPASVRLQCRFRHWKHHEQTGLECPHFSPWFVYESQFALLIKAFYVLGHWEQIIRQQASEMAHMEQEEFVQQQVWKETWNKLHAMLAVCWQLIQKEE
jgi:hypothetical protein